MSLTVNQIIENSERWNIDWLNENRDHILYQTWFGFHKKSDIYASTSCEVTAAAIRWKSDLGHQRVEWVPHENITFKQAQKLSPYFQISIGEDLEGCEHILTIWDKHVIQSYFNEYVTNCFPLDQEFIKAWDDITNPQNFKKVTDVDLDNYDDLSSLKIFYLIPNYTNL